MSGGTQAPRSSVLRPACSDRRDVLEVDSVSSVACISSVACAATQCCSLTMLLSFHSASSASSKSVCHDVHDWSLGRGSRCAHQRLDVLLDARFAAGAVGGSALSIVFRLRVVRAGGIASSASSYSGPPGSTGLSST